GSARRTARHGHRRSAARGEWPGDPDHPVYRPGSVRQKAWLYEPRAAARGEQERTHDMRVGRIGYINCYPVYGAIDRGEVKLPAELVTGTPAELNDLLVAGELDVSVISAVEYAR